MFQFFNALKTNTLFNGFTDEEITEVLKQLSARVKAYSKNQIIRTGKTTVDEIGIVVEGVVFVTKCDYNGNRTILNELKSGQSFGESLAYSSDQNSPIIIVAAEKSTKIIFLSAAKILDGCNTTNPLKSTVVKNLIKLLAEKIMHLQIKNDILSQKTTREKLLLYFEYESKSANSKSFRIMFSRVELSDFLSLNTSAMSRELSKMKEEGILSYHKNKFTLKNTNFTRENS